jgi:hypothetical protein
MNGVGRALVAAATAVLSLALMGWALTVLPASLVLPDAPEPLTVIGAALAMATFPIVGLIVAVRRPNHVIGWLFLLAGLGLSLGIATGEYITQVLRLGTALPAVELVAWLGEWGWVLSFGLAVPLAILLFPDERPSRAGRVLVGLVVAVGTATIMGNAFGLAELADGRVANPFAAPAPLRDVLETGGNVGDVLTMPLLALATIDLIVRARRSSGVPRQQFKWFGGALLVVLAGVAIALPTLFVWGDDPATVPAAVDTIANLGWSLILLGIGLIPVTTGAAILRYRLFDIDRIVSRTLAWSLSSGLLVGIFAVVVLGLQAALGGLTQGDTLAVTASTLLAVALFQQLRRRVQRLVDRRFDRARYDAERTVTILGRQLRDEVDLAVLADRIVATVDATLRPSHAALWLVGGFDDARATVAAPPSVPVTRR